MATHTHVIHKRMNMMPKLGGAYWFGVVFFFVRFQNVLLLYTNKTWAAGSGFQMYPLGFQVQIQTFRFYCALCCIETFDLSKFLEEICVDSQRDELTIVVFFSSGRGDRNNLKSRHANIDSVCRSRHRRRLSICSGVSPEALLDTRFLRIYADRLKAAVYWIVDALVYRHRVNWLCNFQANEWQSAICSIGITSITNDTINTYNTISGIQYKIQKNILASPWNVIKTQWMRVNSIIQKNSPRPAKSRKD